MSGEKQAKYSYIGGHTSITPDILSGIEYMHELGANAIQIFTGPSQSSSLRVKQCVSDPELIKEYIYRNNIKLIIHAIYTLNLCSAPATSNRIKYAQDNLIYDLELGEKIGAHCIVVHIGSQGGLDSETAYANMASNIMAVLHATAKSAPNTKLALEVPAGQGKQIATNLADLTRLWMLCLKGLDTAAKRRLGICLDTAHLFSSGQDIRTIDQLKGYLSAFDSMIGKDNILCIHLNDSKVALGARRDVHQGIGEGYLFGKTPMTDALKVIHRLVKFAKGLAIPVILETHSAGSPDKPGGELYAQEIALLNQLANGNVAGLPKRWRLIHATKTKKKIITQVQPKKIQSSKTAKNNSIQPVMTIAPANIGLINKFTRIKDFYTHVKPDKFRALAYNKAIISLQSYPEEILQGTQVAHLSGVGAKMVEKINEWLQTGNMKIFAEEHIEPLFEAWAQSQKENISNILGFGPTKVRQLAKQGITNITQLRKAVETNGIKLSPGELIGIQYHEDLLQLVPREEAKDIFDKIATELRKSGMLAKYGLRAEIAGSWPSGKAASKDIDVLLFTDKYPDADKASKIPTNIMTDVEACLLDSGILLSTVSIGAGKLMGIIQGKRGGHHIDIRLLPSGGEVFGRFYFTSGRAFNQMVRAHAKQQGYKLNEFGLYDLRKAGARVQGLDSEEAIMAHIGLKYIPMNKRR